MKIFSLLQFRILILLYFLALLLRLPGIMEPAPHPDEVNWQSRSFVTMRLLREGKFSSATSHLGHPGVPPALIMALAQGIGRKLNKFSGTEPGDYWHIDGISSARIGIAAFSSLISPLFYVGAVPFIGKGAAVVGAVMLATDIQHVANARLAHLDSTLSVFVLLCVVFYSRSVFRRSVCLRLAAGFCWGLGLATKPTVLTLIPAFLCWKAVKLALFCKEKDPSERGLLTWGDLWAIIVGHLGLSLVFTRLWHHRSDYKTRLNVVSPLADWAYGAGHFLQQHGSFAVPILLCFIGAALLIRGRKGQGIFSLKPCSAKQHHLSLLLGTAAFLGLWLTLFPEVIENIVRFWTRISGYTELGHESFGYQWTRPLYSYLGLFLCKMDTFSLLSFFAGLVCLIAGWSKLKSTEEGRERLLFLLIVLCCLVIWPLVLSTSTKQSFRYVLPVSSFVYFIAAFGLLTIGQLIGGYFKARLSLDRSPILPGAFALIVVLLVSFRASMIYGVYPDYPLFAGSLVNGAQGAVSWGSPLTFGGYNEALRFMQQQAVDGGGKRQVAIIADENAVLKTYARLFPNDRHRLRIEVMPNLYAADYVMIVWALLPAFRAQFGINLNNDFKNVFTYSYEGMPVTTVLEVQYSSYEVPVRHNLHRAHRLTGGATSAKKLLDPEAVAELSDIRVLHATPARHKAEYLFFGEKMPFQPGIYGVTFTLGIPKSVDVTSLPSDTMVATLEVGGLCRRDLTLQDFAAVGVVHRAVLSCSFTAPRKVEIRGKWQGRVPFFVEGYEIARR